MRDEKKRKEELKFSPGKDVWRVIITGPPLWFIFFNYPFKEQQSTTIQLAMSVGQTVGLLFCQSVSKHIRWTIHTSHLVGLLGLVSCSSRRRPHLLLVFHIYVGRSIIL